MLARESVKARISSEHGISYTEFSYMLLQANDYLWLHDHERCELQIGGSDQWGNILSGADLIRRSRGAAVHALAWPLLTAPDGTKLGKTTGARTWLDPARTSPYQFQGMGLLNTQLGFILPMIGLNMPFAVFWMRTHFQSIPKDISESAGIDGAGPWRNFRFIQIPLAVPALASLAVLMFLGTWNQFMLAIVLIQDPDKRTMAGALQGFVGLHSTDVVLLNAGALLIMAPVIVVFLIFQKYFTKALLAGAVKG